MTKHSQGGVIIPFLLVTLIWSSTWIVIRDQLGVVPTTWSVCYRFLIAGLAMGAFTHFRGGSLNVGRRGLVFASALGLTQFVLNFNFVYRAESYLTSGVVAVVYAMLLIPNSILAFLFFRTSVSRLFIIGSAIAMTGITLMLVHEYQSASVAPDKIIVGILLTFAGLMSASTANVMQGMQIARRLPMFAFLTWAMLIGAAVNAAIAWMTVGPPILDPRFGYMFGVGWLAIAGSVVTFPLYFQLIQRIGPGPAAYTSVLIPILAMVISTFVEGYSWSALAILGAVTAIIGMAIALRAKSA